MWGVGDISKIIFIIREKGKILKVRGPSALPPPGAIRTSMLDIGVKRKLQKVFFFFLFFLLNVVCEDGFNGMILRDVLCNP